MAKKRWKRYYYFSADKRRIEDLYIMQDSKNRTNNR